MARKKLNEAIIIGYGAMGKRHATNLARLGKKVVAVADPAFDETTGAIYRDPDQCLTEKSKDRLVVIASPTYLHAHHAMKALYCGARALYIEKPMCVNIPDADAIRELSEEMKVPVAVGYNFRAHPGFHALVKLIQTPNFFFATYGIDDPTTWPTYQRFGLDSYICSETGGVLWTSSSHAVDMAIALMGRVDNLVASYTPAQGAVAIRMFHTGGGVSSLYNKWMQGHDRTSLLTYSSIEDSITIDLLNDAKLDMHQPFMENVLRNFQTESEGLLVPSMAEAYHGVEVLVAAEKSIGKKGYVLV
jgi:predicted dehydrogenase